jgi:hypothetical protein
MKSITTFLVFIAMTIVCQAQQITSQTLVGSGDVHVANGYSMSYSVGQTAFTTLKGNSYIITQGFQQSQENKTIAQNDLQKIDFQANIYPNPTADILHLSIEGNLDTSFLIQIYTLSGQLVLSQKANGASIDIEVQNLPKGTYFLSLNKGEQKLSAKFIKL